MCLLCERLIVVLKPLAKATRSYTAEIYYSNSALGAMIFVSYFCYERKF